MKKLLIVMMFLCAFFSLYSQELKLSGEMKTGFVTYTKQIGNEDPTKGTYLHNSDTDNPADFGNPQKFVDEPGRFRLNLSYENNNVGMKMRFQIDKFGSNPTPVVPYSFVYGNYFSDQLKLSAGKLGDSPWGIGEAPGMTGELDTVIGIRTEYKPVFVPGLNVGFVLNEMNSQHDTYRYPDIDLKSIIGETVIGASYDHNYFGARVTYRFDSKIDVQNGAELIYRLEEKVLDSYVPGMKIWLSGNAMGLFATGDDDELLPDEVSLKNWLFITYAPETFSAGFRIGFDSHDQRHELYFRPSFYYNWWNLTFGLSAEYAQDFGEKKIQQGSPYSYWLIEPEITLNLGSSSVSLNYGYKDEFANNQKYETTRTSKFSLRFTFVF
jgi:hypothetical protein